MRRSRSAQSQIFLGARCAAQYKAKLDIPVPRSPESRNTLSGSHLCLKFGLQRLQPRACLALHPLSSLYLSIKSVNVLHMACREPYLDAPTPAGSGRDDGKLNIILRHSIQAKKDRPRGAGRRNEDTLSREQSTRGKSNPIVKTCQVRAWRVP